MLGVAALKTLARIWHRYPLRAAGGRCEPDTRALPGHADQIPPRERSRRSEARCARQDRPPLPCAESPPV